MVSTADERLAGAGWLTSQYEPLERRALAEMEAQGHDPREIMLERSLDMRYVGQSHELTVPQPEQLLRDDLNERFHQMHQVRYGYQQTAAEVEIVNLRLMATAPVRPPAFQPEPMGDVDPGEAFIREKPVWFAQRPSPTRLFDRGKLQPGNQVEGPAIIFQYDTTTVVPPGWRASVDSHRNLIAETI
jgi:N-methylhydantoinase A